MNSDIGTDNSLNYIPMNKLIYEKEKSWTFTSINLPYEKISEEGIVLWCTKNVHGKWTMLGGNKFGFEDATDATRFKIQFGIGA
jgi:hypothetical protein